jgi:diguanylate cyclase (GGDEF)-like protein
LNIPFEEQTLAAITLSLGVAAFPENGSTSVAILKAVDAALYRAKREGRSRVVMAG